jgi:anaerobic ribonucleoside-triphosphate reductase activating protein
MKKNKSLATLIKQIDVLVDGRYVDALHSETIKYRGSTNQRIIDVQKSLTTKKTIMTDY